jgi:hypothetical protein
MVRGSNPGGGRHILRLSRPALWSTQPPWTVGLFPEGKMAWTWHCGVEVKERVELHLYSPSGASLTLAFQIPCIGVICKLLCLKLLVMYFFYFNLCTMHFCSVCTIYQQLHYSDNLLIHSTAPTCFDVCTSPSGSFLCVSCWVTLKFI